MCGIIGYVGQGETVPIILDGLKRLEYRGYDSAGIAVLNGDQQLVVRRAQGKLHRLAESIRINPVSGSFGIGHTRWATHGRPTEENAHPHRDCSGDIVVVHNGILENYLSLKHRLQEEGHCLSTETDTELIAHVVEQYYSGNLESAVRNALKHLSGMYALAVICRSEPQKIVVARFGPPIIIGVGEGEYYVTSDVPAILNRTRNMFFLQDGDMAVLTPQGVNLTDFDGNPIGREITRVLWDSAMAEKGGYRHFMLKEIHEQPWAVRQTFIGRAEKSGQVSLEELSFSAAQLASFEKIQMLACGSSWHAALAGRFMVEMLARLPVEVDYGSEFRYRDPLVNEKTLTVAISQSGETADTLAAQREAKRRSSPTLAICNVVGSMMTREAAGALMTHAGPEVGVASTKTFTSQLTALFLLAMHLGRVRRTLPEESGRELVHELLLLPGKLEHVLDGGSLYSDLARQFSHAPAFLFLGRGIHFPIALEGALKLKEISYIHAEGYPAGEMKHGPNALIDENLPVVVIATRDSSNAQSRVRYEKTLSNIQEVRSRGGVVISIACEGDIEEVRQVSRHVIPIPATAELLLPMLEILPLQLLAYNIAVLRGCDVDQPRNLAKSVTVE